MASKPTSKVLSPIKLAHVVLRTSDANFTTMVEFYKTFLGATVQFKNPRASFLTYDDEHHRIAIISFGNLPTSPVTAAGLEHIAFTFSDLNDLTTAYEQRKAHGIVPVWCVNHGPTTSMYYSDPDGNRLETQVDNFETVEGANEFIGSEAFQRNPVGADFDPEELLKRVRSGEAEAELKERADVGPRAFPDSAPIDRDIEASA
ncbi:hypothetical protein MMC20_007915 [Loxospora ochrophaea]|nr:hypothetical protein [Loxospora ochrophaea]